MRRVGSRFEGREATSRAGTGVLETGHWRSWRNLERVLALDLTQPIAPSVWPTRGDALGPSTDERKDGMLRLSLIALVSFAVSSWLGLGEVRGQIEPTPLCGGCQGSGELTDVGEDHF